MRIVQWNSHHGGKRDKDTDPKETLDLAGFGDALAALDPDIVCLNELEQHNGYGNSDQIEALRQRLGFVDWIGAHVNGKPVTVGSAGQANAILSRWPIEQPAMKALPGGRSAVSGVIRGVTIIAVHLANEGATSRVQQVRALMAWPVLQQEPILIAGDFNAAPGAVEIAPLVGAYQDAWLVGRATGIGTAFNQTGVTRRTRIDAVFFKGLTLTRIDVPDTRIHGMFPSDHHPIVADFRDAVAPADPAGTTPSEASVMVLCAAMKGLAQTIGAWTLLATALQDVPLQQITEANAVADKLADWCRTYGQ